MHRPYPQNFKSSGFILLHALWLLLLASLLASIVMALSLSNARDGAAAAAAFHAEMAAESAIHKTLYEILLHGQRSTLLQGQGSRSTSMKIDGAEVLVRVWDASGQVDLNVSDESTLRRLMAALPAVNANTVIAAIKAARPIVSYAALAALDGMTREAYEALFPHVTLYSRQSVPSAERATEWLARALHIEKPRQGVLEDGGAITGRVFRIEAIARSQTANSRRLDAEILVTGRRDQPFFVYEWSWRSQ